MSISRSFGAVGLMCVSLAIKGVAHEVVVHKKLTERSASAVAQQSIGYQEFFKLIASESGSVLLSYNGTPKTPAEWLIEGSAREDDIDAPGDEGGIRVYGHFYDPLSGQGLSNLPPDQKRWEPFGLDSFTWGTKLNADGIQFRGLDVPPSAWNSFPVNRWAWQNAREHQLAGLTQSSASLRNQNLAQLYRSLGHVVHLVQDLAQPQHVRDEQHVDKFWIVRSPWKSKIETYGALNADRLNYRIAMLDWKAAGFTKLRDFWDRDFYTWNRNNPTVRSHQALLDHEDIGQPEKTLGLAEYVNGNFLGERHIYRERIPLSHGFHYPYPSLMDGTDFALLVSQPGAHGKPTNIPDGPGTRFNVTKLGQGRAVFHHASITFLTAMNPLHPDPKAVNISLDDPDVLKTYHDILIPEAIRYSAGVIDYFFRGRLAVGTIASSTPGQVGLRVINRSRQALLDGAFSLYYDDTAGTRTQINPTSTTYTSPLADNASFTLEFTPPTPPPVAYVLVYKGTVGASGFAALDSVDAGIAIAAAKFTRDAFIDRVPIDNVQDLGEDGSVVGQVAATGRPAYYSGVTRTTQDTRTSIDSGPTTVSQSGNTLTASDVLFTAGHVGRLVKFASGQTATITAFLSPTQVAVTPNQTVSPTTIMIQGATLGGAWGVAMVCNGNGILAGQEEDTAGNVKCFWLNPLSGEIRAIGDENTYPVDIDEAGWLLLRTGAFGAYRSSLYNPVVQTSTDLGVLQPGGETLAHAMNASHVVALIAHGGGLLNPYRWTDGSFVSIQPAGVYASTVVAINSSGQIVGQCVDDATIITRGFFNAGGASTVFGSPANTFPKAINNNGVVVGTALPSSGAVYSLPFRRTASGDFTYIPLLAGTTGGTAYAINNSGDVVGDMDGIAFLYRGGTTHKLITLVAGIQGATGWTELTSANFINDNNDIVGYGIHNGVHETYRLHIPP